MATQGATAGYAAGEQTNAMPLLYAQEANAGTPPGGAWQKLRYTGESMAVQDTTATPDEINDNAEDAETVLTGRAVSGNINGVLSYGTYDDFLAGVMSNDWAQKSLNLKPGSKQIIQVKGNDAASNINKSSIWVSDGSGRGVAVFSGLRIGDFISVSDPASGMNYTAAVTKISDTNDVLFFDHGSFSLSEDPVVLGPAGQVKLLDIINAKVNKTFSMCKPLAGQSQIFTMNFVNQLQISMQRGQTPTVQIDLTGSDMQITSSSPAVSVTPANNSPIMDVVNGFKGLTIFGHSPAGCVQSATLTLKRNNSGQGTGMGHVGACGVQFGSFAATLDVEYFFKDWQQFTDWQAGKKGPVSLSIVGADGYGYTFTILNARIFNPQNPSDGKNKTIVAKLSIVGNPAPGGGTLAITRITPN